MKQQDNTRTMQAITAATFAAFLLAFQPLTVADDEEIEKVKVKDEKVKVKGEDGKVKIKDGKVKLKGDVDEELKAAREAMTAEQKAELKARLRVDYEIPKADYIYLEAVPETYMTKLEPAPEGHVYRYFDGTVYTINSETNTVLSVRTFDD